jgi:two-component system nitrogen regulation response regulator NtrX
MARPVVLVVDDEVPLLTLVDGMLGRLGYDARLGATATDAVIFAEAERPDVILLDVVLLDVVLPGADGTSTLDRLRALHPDVPIVMVTGNSDENLARETLRHGAFDYIVKPFGIQRLAAVLETALANSDP